VWACANKQEIKPTLHSAHTYGYYKYTDHEIKNSTKREEEEEESNNIYYIKVDARCDFDMPNYGREIQKKRKEEENGKKKKKSTTFYFYYFYDYFFVCLKGEVYKALVVGSGRSVSWKLSEARKSCRTFCAVMRREAQADGFLPISFVLLDLSFPK
jgi:lipocalin